MEKKKSVPPSSSSSEESSSGEEDENEQGFVRSDRKQQRIEAQQKADVESESEEGEEEEEEEGDEGGDEVDGTQKAKADEASSPEDNQSSHGEGDADSGSETSSASEGKPDKTSHQFVVLPSKVVENANGHSGKKAPKSEKLSKSNTKLEASPKKGKDKASKRDRETASVAEKGSSKKQKKESSDLTAKSVEHLPKAKDSEKSSKGKSVTSNAFEKKNDSKKSAQAIAIAEKPSTQQNSAKKSESALAKKAADKGKGDKKVAKNADPERAKGSLSPVKTKLFTGKDEIVLTTAILHDIQQGIELPVKKNDGYWSGLADKVEEKMEGSWSKEQLCEKTKRMKVRYTSMADKFKERGERKFRNSVDQDLFAMWDQLWGNGDATKVDDVKSKQSKVSIAAGPVKGGKASRDKAPMQDVKVVAEESEGNKGNEDVSESEQSDGDGDSHKKDLVVTPMEMDLKDADEDRVLVPENNAGISLSHLGDEAQRVFHKEIQATIAEIQESSRQTLKELQSKAVAVVENAVKALADQARNVNGSGLGGFDGLSTPYRSLDMSDMQLSEGDQALQRQWHELRLKELDVYRQRLELMQRECQLKQDQMKLQFHKNN